MRLSTTRGSLLDPDQDEMEHSMTGIDNTTRRPGGIDFSVFVFPPSTCPPFLPSSFSSSRFWLDLFCISPPSGCARLPKLSSPLSTLENESLVSLSLLVCPEENKNRKETQERLNGVITRPDSSALLGPGVLSRPKSGKKVPKQLQNRRLNEDEDEDDDDW
jgi:hypothetical protein